MSEQNNGKVTLPYGSYHTLKAFIGKLKQSAIPPRIDNSVMVGMSGSGKSELRASLKFLGLVDASDIVQQPLRTLVESYGEVSWPQEIGDRLFAAYSDVTTNEGEWLDNGTHQQLRDRFRAVAGDVSTLDRAIRFFLAGMADAGVKLSPFFTMKGAKASSGGSRPANPKRKSPKPKGEGTHTPPPPNNPKDTRHEPTAEPGTTRYPFTMPSGSGAVILPDSMGPEEWAVVHGYIDGMLKLKRKK